MDSQQEALNNMIKNLEEKTGKTLADWVELIKGFGPLKHGEVVKRLKSEFGLGHGYANLLAHEAASKVVSAPAAGDDLVAAMFSGGKEALRPLYEKIVAKAQDFGSDLEISPKKTYVSLRRKKQFALVQPSTKTRLDLGLNLKGVEPSGRLEASGSFNSMCSHRMRIESENDLDESLFEWLRQAYSQA